MIPLLLRRHKVVTCVRRAPTRDGTHEHITHLGLRGALGSVRWVTLADATAHLRSVAGNRYHVLLPTSGDRIDLVAGSCEVCGYQPYLQTRGDGLQELPRCHPS